MSESQAASPATRRQPILIVCCPPPSGPLVVKGAAFAERNLDERSVRAGACLLSVACRDARSVAAGVSLCVGVPGQDPALSVAWMKRSCDAHCRCLRLALMMWRGGEHL
jgi:hypothetical protein